MDNITITAAKANHIASEIVDLLQKSNPGLLNSLHILKKAQEKIESLISES